MYFSCVWHGFVRFSRNTNDVLCVIRILAVNFNCTKFLVNTFIFYKKLFRFLMH